MRIAFEVASNFVAEDLVACKLTFLMHDIFFEHGSRRRPR
jgi:hypothetical protein